MVLLPSLDCYNNLVYYFSFTNSKQKNTISIIADLRLFKIQDEKNIIFYSANPQEKGDAIDLPRLYDEFKGKQLVIKIGSSNASTFTYKDKIHNIVK